MRLPVWPVAPATITVPVGASAEAAEAEKMGYERREEETETATAVERRDLRENTEEAPASLLLLLSSPAAARMTDEATADGRMRTTAEDVVVNADVDDDDCPPK